MKKYQILFNTEGGYLSWIVYSEDSNTAIKKATVELSLAGIGDIKPMIVRLVKD